MSQLNALNEGDFANLSKKINGCELLASAIPPPLALESMHTLLLRDLSFKSQTLTVYIVQYPVTV